MKFLSISHKNLKKTLNSAAFTLAEVLIVVGIIGIIAEFTVPNLVADYNKQVYSTLLKKAYLTFQTGMKTYMADEGVSELGFTEIFDMNTDFTNSDYQDKLDETMRKYFAVQKSCKYGDSSCTISHYRYLKRATKSNMEEFKDTGYNFCTNDGICYALNFLHPVSGARFPCASNPAKIGKIKGRCGTLQVDINGPKAPNVYGRDLHLNFALAPDGNLYSDFGMDSMIYASGDDWRSATSYWENLTYLCGSAHDPNLPSNTIGQCLPRLMDNGWVMDY